MDRQNGKQVAAPEKNKQDENQQERPARKDSAGKSPKKETPQEGADKEPERNSKLLSDDADITDETTI